MKPRITFTKIWADQDMVALRVEICDGSSLFANQIYVGHQQLADNIAGLNTFKDHIYGGLFNLRFGEFGPEYASGALDVRLHFRKHGKILARVSAQSEFSRFEDQDLASEVTLHLMSEPALLDSFILALRALSEGSTDQAELEAISLNWVAARSVNPLGVGSCRPGNSAIGQQQFRNKLSNLSLTR